jgi:predicted NBD/HSP70 family sugar kinase
MARTTPTGARSESVRLTNQSAVLREVHLAGGCSRSALVPATGLTRGAVGTIVGDLVELGLVEEERATSDGSPGRPSTLVRPSDRAIVVAMDVRVETISVGVFTLGGRQLGATRVARHHDHGAERILADLAELARGHLARLPSGSVVHGVGVSVAGVVRQNDQVVVVAPNLGWFDVPVGSILRDEFGANVRVAVGNDGDLAALAESRRGVATGMRDVVHIMGEVGIGGGMIVAGQPLVGAAGFAGEVGHIPVNLDGLPCMCGSAGCWETEAGDHALLRRAGRTGDAGSAAIDALIRDAEDGDPTVLAALAEHGVWVAFGLAGIINVFDPDLIVLGGSFARIHPHIADALERELDRRVFDVVRAQVDVVASRLGLDAPLIGAAEWAWEAILDNPRAARRSVPTVVLNDRSLDKGT